MQRDLGWGGAELRKHRVPNAQRYSPRKQGLFQKIPGRVPFLSSATTKGNTVPPHT